jgi:hypothetical protein
MSRNEESESGDEFFLGVHGHDRSVECSVFACAVINGRLSLNERIAQYNANSTATDVNVEGDLL